MVYGNYYWQRHELTHFEESLNTDGGKLDTIRTVPPAIDVEECKALNGLLIGDTLLSLPSISRFRWENKTYDHFLVKKLLAAAE